MLIVVENLLSKDEVAEFRAALDAADWDDGARTAGSLGRGLKHNHQLDETSATARALSERIVRKLGVHPLFVSAALPRKIYPPRFNHYSGGGHYGAHVDSALMRVPNTDVTVRSDLSCTLFLSEPEEYDGGELQIEGAFGAQSIKLAAGDMILYLASSLHRVTPVTRGARTASFFCIESLVRDDGERTLLFDLDQAIQRLTATAGADNPELMKLAGVYHNLLRRWSIT